MQAILAGAHVRGWVFCGRKCCLLKELHLKGARALLMYLEAGLEALSRRSLVGPRRLANLYQPVDNALIY